jgi:hypothetical protein
MLNVIIKITVSERKYKADERQRYVNGSVKCNVLLCHKMGDEHNFIGKGCSKSSGTINLYE